MLPKVSGNMIDSDSAIDSVTTSMEAIGQHDKSINPESYHFCSCYG